MPPLSRADGMPVGALNGFASALLGISRGVTGTDAATHLVVVFDATRRTFRHDLAPDYKANRAETADDLKIQFGHVRRLVDGMGIARIERDNYEADDVIATLAKQAVTQGIEVVIHSSDKDLLQLIRPGVVCYCPIKKERRGYNECIAKLGVPPDMVIDFQALVGDGVDNVCGVSGIGPKTAATLLKTYGGLQAVLDAARDPFAFLPCSKKQRQALIDEADAARLSRELVTLRADLDLGVPLDDFRFDGINVNRARAIFAEFEFMALSEQLDLAA